MATELPAALVEKLISAHAVTYGVRHPNSTDAEALAEVGSLVGEVLRALDPAYRLADHIAAQMKAA